MPMIPDPLTELVTAAKKLLREVDAVLDYNQEDKKLALAATRMEEAIKAVEALPSVFAPNKAPEGGPSHD